MSKLRIIVGEWLHALANMVLPIPAFAKAETNICDLHDGVLLESAYIAEGRDIYDLSVTRGVDIDTAKEIAIMEAKREITHHLLTHAGERIQWSEVRHGTNKRVYFEIRGKLLVR